jgi:hypothetical protein
MLADHDLGRLPHAHSGQAAQQVTGDRLLEIEVFYIGHRKDAYR